MKPIDYVAESLVRSHQMIAMTLADISDADMLVRPVPAANHAAWQLGHLIASNSRLGAGIGAKLPDLGEFPKKFTKETASSDDASKFPTKAEMLKILQQQLDALASHVRSMSDADLAKDSPEAIRERFPKVGNLVVLIPLHHQMHLGQFQVIRRKLGKPVLF